MKNYYHMLAKRYYIQALLVFNIIEIYFIFLSEDFFFFFSN